ncbi:MAG: hypothetical protein RLY40_487 [Pseudomonadota bacterium]|jgi:hypothetical protein
MQRDCARNRWFNYYFIILLGLYTANSFAASLAPRLSANAYTGVYTVGSADLMLSVDGDEVHNLYVNPQATFGSDQQWLADLGLGYRWIKNDAAILGWYAFAGRTRVNNNSDFWIANPGLEVLGRRWDSHLNAYIPVAGRSNEVNYRVELNSISEPFFTGHSEVINSVFDLANEVREDRQWCGCDVGLPTFSTGTFESLFRSLFF